jgi:ribokinase
MGRVLVAGSINMDVVATAERHPRIGETVPGKEVLYFPGGKGANQAVASAKLGTPTTLIGRLGQDAFGDQLKAFLESQHVDTSEVRQVPGAHTGTAIITLANADNTIVVVPGANGTVAPDDVATLSMRKGDVAVSQFEIPLPAIAAFFTRARAHGATTLLNPAPMLAFDRGLLDLVDILVLNETELGTLAGTELHDTEEPARIVAAARALTANRGQIICVTLGKRGAIALLGCEIVTIPGRKVEAIDSTGAGDCFVGALAAQLAAGASISDALGFANRAASISVQRMGAAPSMPTMQEVIAAP